MTSSLQNQGILLYAIGISLVAGVLFGSDKSIMAGTPATIKEQNQSWLLDYDINGRSIAVTAKSADGLLNDCQTVTAAETGKGVYLSWKVTGPATLKVRKIAGYNVVVSGVFVCEI